MCYMQSLEMQGTKKSPKFRHWAPSHNFLGQYLRNWGTYRQLEKNLLNSNISPTSLQYGELRPTSSWDLLASLGHPNKFQRVSHLGSVTAWYSSSGRDPNFAVLNRGHHLYSAGRPSRWALAHISGLPLQYLAKQETSNCIFSLKCFRTLFLKTDDRLIHYNA